MGCLLTVGITSYKRVEELKRCIRSIQTKYVDDIEILVSEDHSPLSDEIKVMVEEEQKATKYNLIFSTNEKNLGYDGNLGAIIKKSHGKYIFFLSDDDAVYDNFLDELIEFLKKEENSKYGVLYSPFVYTDTNKKDRNRLKNFAIEASEDNASKYVYDSILFSGLVFKKEYVEGLDAARFKNLNYFQVYMFLTMVFKYGGYYFKNPSIKCIGDGENAYGLSESSGGNALLANRKSVISNLEFNKTLIKVIRMFDADNNTKVINSFARQYSIHSYSGLSIARLEGKKYFKEYYTKLKTLDIKLYPVVKIYHAILYIFGTKFSNKFMNVFKRIYKKD